MTEVTETIFIVTWFLSYPVNSFVIYDLIWELNLKGKMRTYSKMEQTFAAFGIRLALVVVSTTLAMLPQFHACETLVYSFTVPLLILGFPAMIELCLCWEMHEFGRFHCVLIKNVLMLVFTLYCIVIGVVQTIKAYATGEIHTD